jgi:hypothetical protein
MLIVLLGRRPPTYVEAAPQLHAPHLLSLLHPMLRPYCRRPTRAAPPRGYLVGRQRQIGADYVVEFPWLRGRPGGCPGPDRRSSVMDGLSVSRNAGRGAPEPLCADGRTTSTYAPSPRHIGDRQQTVPSRPWLCINTSRDGRARDPPLGVVRERPTLARPIDERAECLTFPLPGTVGR